MKSFVLLGVFFLLPATLVAKDKPFTESVVIFNTICAKCHEAQCSGRMCLGEAFEYSTSHILRYYEQASGKRWLQKELFDILNYMKEKCAYYPMKIGIPLKRVWGHETLDKLSTLVEKNYFIPVGHFSPGNYQVELELEKDTKVTAHLISEEFEMAAEDCFLSNDGKLIIPFTIEESGDYYFRMYPQDPARIIKLAITPVKNKMQAPFPRAH